MKGLFLLMCCLTVVIASPSHNTVQKAVQVHKIIKRQSGSVDAMLDFTPECTAAFGQISTVCMANILSLIDTYKTVETDVAGMWADQCADNLYDCISSPDAETDKVIEFFGHILPQIKSLCFNGCMVPIIHLIHSCLKKELLADIGISKDEMEDIFDLVCLQEDSDKGEGEYCIIKAMTTASYLTEANKIFHCDMDSVNLPNCTAQHCECNANCSMMLTKTSALMGCCMGTILDLESQFNLKHPVDDDLLNPGNQLFKVCNVVPEEKCMTSQDVIDAQNVIYRQCFAELQDNAETSCVQLEDDVHTTYLADMQNISKKCTEKKNINVCKSKHSEIHISDDLRSVLTQLNSHCDKCQAELAGIRDNCTVFLPNEAKMVFQMMCLQNSDAQQCGPRIIEYEAEMERKDLNSNPCFTGHMSEIQNACSPNCTKEVETMNTYNVLNCFDALIEYTHTPIPEWQAWHRNCVKDVDVQNRLNLTYIVYQKEKSIPTAQKSNKSEIVKTVGYTFIGTILLSLLLAGIVYGIYKRHRIYEMFGYNKFEGDDQLISDVHMEDTLDGEHVYHDF